jgi:hypothetical protein
MGGLSGLRDSSIAKDKADPIACMTGLLGGFTACYAIIPSVPAKFQNNPLGAENSAQNL